MTLKSSDGASPPPRRGRGRRPSTKAPDRAGKPVKEPRRLIDTPGPDAAEPPEHLILTIGVVAGTHGLGGEIKVRLISDDLEYIMALERVVIGEGSRSWTVQGSRMHAGHLLLSLERVTTPEEAAKFRGQSVRAPASALRPLAPGEFFIYQLLGLHVVTEDGETLGTVTDLMETGANDVLVITPPSSGDDLLLPMTPSVVIEIDPAAGKIVARPLEYY